MLMDIEGFLIVRSKVHHADDWDEFNRWYGEWHTPLACRELTGILHAWRLHDHTEPRHHIGVYAAGDLEALQTEVAGEVGQRLKDDYDGRWGERVSRTRDVASIVDAWTP